MKKNNLYNLSENRSLLMGLAILWVYLFHSLPCNIPVYDDIIIHGNWGVDIFFFLSGYGLSFSLSKDDKIARFFKKRAIRILPTWFTVLLAVSIIGLFKSSVNSPHSITQAIMWFTGIGYWLQFNFVNPFQYFYEWYVPTLIVFYLLAPLIFRLSIRNLALVFVISITITLFLIYYNYIPWLNISYRRFPIYLLGFIAFKVKDDKSYKVLIATFVMTIAGVLISLLPSLLLFRQMLLPICFMLPFCAIVGATIRIMKLSTVFTFLGSISLELYLIHIYNRPQNIVSRLFGLEMQSISCVLLTLTLLVLVAYLLQYTINYLTLKFKIRKQFNKKGHKTLRNI